MAPKSRCLTGISAAPQTPRKIYINTKVSDQSVAVELDETKKNYLHPLADTEAAKIGVGLFMKATE